MADKKNINLAKNIKDALKSSDQTLKEILILLKGFFQGHETIDMRYKLYRRLEEVKANHKLIEKSLKKITTNLKKKKSSKSKH